MKITLIAALVSAMLSAGASWKITRQTITATWSAKLATVERDLAVASQDAAEALRDEATAQRERVDAAATVTALEGDLARKKERIALLEAAQYVPPATSCNCDLDADWVSRYNAAARLSDPRGNAETAGGAVDSPRNVADALNVTAQNFADCARWRRSLVGWQRYYASLSGD